MSRFPWKNTSEDIAARSDPQYETPGGAQSKADKAEQNAKDYSDRQLETFRTNPELNIANESIVERHIRDGAVTTPKIRDQAVTPEKMSPSSLDASNHTYTGKVAASTVKGAIDTQQDWIDHIVQNSGDSVIEIVDARVSDTGDTYDTLKKRLDAQHKDVITKISYKDKQIKLISEGFKKLELNEGPVKIAMVGDSKTYGTDLNSADKRDPYPATFPDGSVNTATRAAKTVPEALEEALQSVYGASVTVENMGRSGDYVRSGYSRWKFGEIHYDHDFMILGYGINDSRNAGCPYMGDVVQFIVEYKKMIETILDDNIAIILLDLTKMAPNDHPLLDKYSIAIRELGAEYGIPVFEASELMANYSASYYSDITHLNGAGNDITGKKMASIFVGGGCLNKNIVTSHSQLLTRPQLDRCYWGEGVAKAYGANYPTPDEVVANNGFGVRLNAGEFIIYNFYCANDLLIPIPNIMFIQTNSKAKFTLDFGIPQPKMSNDYFTLKDTVSFAVESSTLQINYGTPPFTGSNINYSLKEVLNSNVPYLTMATKGWHTIKIEAIDNDINVFGVSFLNHYDLNKLNYSLNFLGVNGLRFDIGSGKTMKLYQSNGRITIKEENDATASFAVTENEIIWGRSCRFTGLTSEPDPIKGGLYFDATLSKFRKCDDGLTWSDL